VKRTLTFLRECAHCFHLYPRPSLDGHSPLVRRSRMLQVRSPQADTQRLHSGDKVNRLMIWWRRRQRRIDKRILFPEIRRASRDREHYWRMIFFHVLDDPAWRVRDEWKDEEPGLYEHMIFLDRALR